MKSFDTENTGISRAIIFAGFIAILAISFAIWFFLFRETYTPVASSLSQPEAAELQKILKDNGYQSKLANNDTTLEVKDVDFNSAKKIIVDSKQGVGHVVGYELFDKAEYGVSEFTQQIMKLRAIQGELERTINRMDGVKASRVHVLAKKETLFDEPENSAKASVYIEGDYKKISQPGFVKAVQKLVSSSVANLPTSSVVVVADNGRVLSKADEDDSAFVDHWEKKVELEKILERKAFDIVSQIYDPSQVYVKVNLEFDHDKIRKHVEKPLTSGEKNNNYVVEKKESSKSSAVDADSTSSARADGNSSSIMEYKYALGKIIEESSKDQKYIKRITASILLPAGMKDKDIKIVSDIVEAAIGINETRGDYIVVKSVIQNASVDPAADSAIALPAIPAEPEKTTMHKEENPLDANVAIYIGLGILAVVLIIAVLNAIHRKSVQERMHQELDAWLNESSGKNNA